jgi:hypothetical protein
MPVRHRHAATRFRARSRRAPDARPGNHRVDARARALIGARLRNRLAGKRGGLAGRVGFVDPAVLRRRIAPGRATRKDPPVIAGHAPSVVRERLARRTVAQVDRRAITSTRRLERVAQGAIWHASPVRRASKPITAHVACWALAAAEAARPAGARAARASAETARSSPARVHAACACDAARSRTAVAPGPTTRAAAIVEVIGLSAAGHHERQRRACRAA